MGKDDFDYLIIGGGAAGVFSAIMAAENNPSLRIAVLEATGQLLTKVKVSGGGRCNVTHNEFNGAQLVKSYPRGNKELRGPFSVFCPRQMLDWLHENGVETHAEEDGRIFPASNDSSTIIELFQRKLRELKIRVIFNERVQDIAVEDSGFSIKTKSLTSYKAGRVLIATGGSKSAYALAEKLGHTIIPPVPSLFTFSTKDKRLAELSGTSFENVELKLTFKKKKFTQRGPMLITHWGLSGPAVIKLSAWAARELFENDYKAQLLINFYPGKNQEEIKESIEALWEENGKKQINNVCPPQIPKRYWKNLLVQLDIAEDKLCNVISKKDRARLLSEMACASFYITGKGEFKEEFVTAGGVKLKEVNFKTMESKCVPGLYFAGEALDIDGVTGGFNFQNAWTTGYLAALA